MSIVDLSAIKNSIQSTLLASNTTTGSPIDLSNGMTARVKQVLQINIDRIPVQPSFFPFVTMFFDSKTIKLQEIASNLLLGRRRAEIDLKIVGVVWLDDISSSNFSLKDLADNECEKLMENIEEVLRSSPTIDGNVLFAASSDVTYHSYSYTESAHLRAGILNHKITVQY